MRRDWRGERDWWLDHFFQWQPRNRRSSNLPGLNKGDHVAVPLPFNLPTPLAEPCLAWRWGLDRSGYGRLRNKGAHVVAYEQTRGKPVDSGLFVLHLCHRPFCVQPAHLYAGTTKQNSEDTQAVHSELHTYRTWAVLGDRYDRALNEHRYPAPLVEGSSQGMSPREARGCPHWFVRPARGARSCANCGEMSAASLFSGHRDACSFYEASPTRPCRCQTDPCCCKGCLALLLGPAQRAYESDGNPIEGPLFDGIPAALDEDAPLPKAEAQRIRGYLMAMAGLGGRRGEVGTSQ